MTIICSLKDIDKMLAPDQTTEGDQDATEAPVLVIRAMEATKLNLMLQLSGS